MSARVCPVNGGSDLVHWSVPDLAVEDWRRTTVVRLDLLAETYGDLLDDADPNARLRAAKGLASVERDRAELFAGGWSESALDLAPVSGLSMDLRGGVLSHQDVGR